MVVGLILVLFLGSAAWFYWNSDVCCFSGENNPSRVQAADRALAAVICRGEECFWLNKEGISFNKSGRTSGNLVVNLEDKTGRELKIGNELLGAEFLAELSFIKRKVYEDLSLNLRSGEIGDSSLKDFNFITNEGWLLRLSVAENAYKTLETLKQTLAEIKKTAPTAGLEYIDLRVPNKVYYKFR